MKNYFIVMREDSDSYGWSEKTPIKVFEGAK